MSRKNTKKNIILITIIIIAIVIATIVIIKVCKNKSIKLEEISEADIKYYVLQENEKYGVLQSDGTVVIEPQYAQLVIPNPTKDIFICSDSDENNTIYKAVNSSNSRILENYQDVQAISINPISSIIPYEKTVLKYREGNLYGIINFSGKKLTEAIYEEISNLDYKEGYLKVKKDGQYGIIDIDGKVVIKAECDNVMSDGYYNKETKYAKAGFVLREKTDNGYKFGYANSNGKIILETNYNEINRITEIEDDKNIYLISSVNGKYGLIKNGKQILENEYQEIDYDKTNNIVIVKKGVAQGVFDINGKNIIPIDYDNIVVGGDYINAIKGEKNIVFDSKGNEINTELTSHNKVSDNYSIVIDKENNYNIVDKDNNQLLKEKYVYIEYYNNDIFIVTKGNKTGLINANEKVIVPLEYATIQKIKETELLSATSADNQIDIIKPNGQVVTGLENAIITKEDNYIKLSSSAEMKYYTLDGKETSYKDLYPDKKIYASKKNNKWGFVDKNNNLIVDYKYDMVTELENNVAGIKLDEKWGVIDSDGKIILEPTYQLNTDNVKFLNKYYSIKSGLGLPQYYKNNQ